VKKTRYKLDNIFLHKSTKGIEIKNIVIRERLGGGNFGDVYRGIWMDTTEVALKKLKSVEHIEEFALEASTLQNLRHRNIVQFFGTYTSPDNVKYIVTEFMPKGSLDQLLQVEKKAIGIVSLLAMAKDALAGMLYLHEQNRIHRDLALRNLLVAGDGNKYVVKVADFGMARIVDKDYYKKRR